MTVTYNAKSQCLRAVSTVLACYGHIRVSKRMWDTAYDEENQGDPIPAFEIAKMLQDEGVPCRLVMFEPACFDNLNDQPAFIGRPCLLQVRGVGGQTERFFVVAAMNAQLGANVYMNLPRGFDINETPPRDKLFTGLAVVPENIPQALQEKNTRRPRR